MRILALCILSLLSVLAFPQNTFLRQMAKDNAKTHIVYGGPETRPLADEIVRMIRTHPEFKNKQAIAPLALENLDSALNAKDAVRKESFVLLLCKSENPVVSPTTRAALNIPSDALEGTGALISGYLVNKSAGYLSFHIVLAAPDVERLQRIVPRLADRTWGDWRSMNLVERYSSAKFAVRANMDAPGSLEVGPRQHQAFWIYRRDLPATGAIELGPEEDLFVYVDRSRPLPDIPEPILGKLVALKPPENSIFAFGTALPSGKRAVILSGPNDRMTRRALQKFNRIEDFPETPVVETVPDWRSLQSTTVLVHGEGMDKASIESVRSAAASAIRSTTKLDVRERGAVLAKLEQELSLQDLLGSTKTAKMLREKHGIRYIWLVYADQPELRTTFSSNVRRANFITDTYNEPAPRRPDDERPSWMSQESFNAEWRRYREAKALYDSEKYRHENEISCPWRRTVVRSEQASMPMKLMLFDLQGGVGKVLIEVSAMGRASSNSTHREDEVAVQGSLSRPSSLPAPEAIQGASPKVLADAGRDGAESLANNLADTHLFEGKTPANVSWLAGSVVTPGPTVKPEPVHPAHTSPTEPPKTGKKVLRVVGAVVTVGIGQAEGVRIGHIIHVPTATKTVADAVTGERRQVVTAKVVLRVIKVSANGAECRPASGLDSKKLKFVKPGMSVLWFPK